MNQSVQNSQDYSQTFISYSIQEGKSFFQNYCEEVMKKKIKKRIFNTNSHKLNSQSYSVFNLFKNQKQPPKLGNELLARQLQNNFIQKKTVLQVKEQHQLSLYKDLQKTQSFKAKYVRHLLNQIPTQKHSQAENFQSVKIKKQINDLFLENVQKNPKLNQITQKKIKTQVRQVDLVNLNFICFCSFLLNRTAQSQYFKQLQQWKLNIRKNLSQVFFNKNINDNLQNFREIQLKYIKYLLLSIIPFQTYSNFNLKVVKQWQTNFVQREQKQIICKRLTGKISYKIEKKGRIIAEEKLKLYHFKKEKQLSLGCLKNAFCRELLFKRRQKQKIFEFNQKKIKTYGQDQKKNHQGHNKFSEENHIKNIKKIEFSTNNFIQKNKSIKQQKKTQNFQQSNKQFQINVEYKNSLKLHENPLLYHIKNKSKKSPITIAALDQFTYSKNIKSLSSNGNNLKKHIVFYKPSPKLIDKQNMELLLKNNKFSHKIQKFKSSFYPIYIGQLKIQSPIQSYLQYQCENEQLKTFPAKFLSDRIKSQQNKIVIIIPTLLNRQIEEKLKKMVKTVVSLGGKLKFKNQDPYKFKNRQYQLDLMIYHHLTKVPNPQIIKFLQIQEKTKQQFNNNNSQKR